MVTRARLDGKLRTLHSPFTRLSHGLRQLQVSQRVRRAKALRRQISRKNNSRDVRGMRPGDPPRLNVKNAPASLAPGVLFSRQDRYKIHAATFSLAQVCGAAL